MFDGAYAVAAALDGRAARSVYDVVAECGYYGLPFEVGAAEYDPRVDFGGIDGHGYLDACVEPLAGE